MSYARMGNDSDVYVLAISEGLTCMACRLLGDDLASYNGDEKQMLRHLTQHRKNGHKVPQRTFDRIMREMEERF